MAVMCDRADTPLHEQCKHTSSQQENILIRPEEEMLRPSAAVAAVKHQNQSGQ